MSSIYDTLEKTLYRKIDANVLQTTDIDPENIGAGSVLSTMIQNVGVISSGKIEFTNDDTGYILGLDEGTAKFYIGDSMNFINWDGSAMTIAGSLSVEFLTAGTISSKSIVLAVTGGAGDVEIRSGISTGDFDNSDANSGFIIGVDDSDADTAKFYFGDTANHIEWDGATLTIRGKLIADTTPLHIFMGESIDNYTVNDGAAGTTTVTIGHISMALDGTAAGGGVAIRDASSKSIDWSQGAIIEFEFKMSATTIGSSGSGTQTWYLFSGQRSGETPQSHYVGIKLTASEDSNPWAVETITKNGSTEESQSISMTTTDVNNIRIEFTNGVDVKFYLNDTLTNTHSTNIPSTTGNLMTLKGGIATQDTDAITMSVGKFIVNGKGSF